MKGTVDLYQEANNLRKEKKFADAAPLYEKAWSASADQYNGAGLLQCLRKTDCFEKAIPLAKELLKKYPEFAWARNEAIWTLISGELNRLDEDTTLETVIDLARKIMELKPEDLAAKVCVFKVLKAAKAAGKWDVVGEWTYKLDPDRLSTTPMTDERGREGWNDQSLWYNYKCNFLIKKDKAEEVLRFIDQVIEKHPGQRKFFLRIKAIALHKTNRLDEAEGCYKNLCSVRKPDWWLLQEYARVVKDKGNRGDALKLMCQAANSNNKLDLMVALFQEMGLLFKENGDNDAARSHLALASLIRRDQEWSIPGIILDSLSELNMTIGNDYAPTSIKNALSMCRKEWEKILGISALEQRTPNCLSGKVRLGNPERAFCFIIDGSGESYYCLKSDLPRQTKDGDTVVFNAIPSFDKKKNRESWKATNISAK